MKQKIVYKDGNKEFTFNQLKQFVNHKGLKVGLVGKCYHGFYKNEQSGLAFDVELECYKYCADFINNDFKSL